MSICKAHRLVSGRAATTTITSVSRPLLIELLETRSMLATIQIWAAGQMGDEQIELRIAGVPAQVWSDIGGDIDSRQFRLFEHIVDEEVSPEDVQVAFLNDVYLPEQGIDRNLLVDAIAIDGERFETEAPTVFSTGVWKEYDGVQAGFREDEVLATIGYFHYGQTPQPGSIALETSVLSVAEAAGSITLNIIRTGGADGRVSVEYATVPVTAAAGSDYLQVSGTATFRDGESLVTITIPILDNALAEGDETFAFTIDSIVGGMLSAPRTATITIQDDDLVRGLGEGLLGVYFPTRDFNRPAVTRVDKRLNFDWKQSAPHPSINADGFAVRWTGQLEPKFTERTTLELRADDGVRMWLDGQLIIDKWLNQKVTSHRVKVNLQAGRLYDVRVEYYDDVGAATARLLWFGPSQPREVIPMSQLYPAEPPEYGAENLVRQELYSGLDFPTSFDFSPDGSLMYIAEKPGRVRLAERGQLLDKPFLDWTRNINGAGDRGLLSIAVHPQFPTLPYIYLIYTVEPEQVYEHVDHPFAGPDGSGNRAGRVSRVTANAATGYRTVVPGSEVVLVGRNSQWENYNAFANSTSDFDEPPAGILPDGSNLRDFIATDSESHTVADLRFAADGSLLVSIGDGTSYNRADPRTIRVQDIDNLSGKVLRIDPMTGKGYSDNPFYDGDATSNRSKVYQFGLRNPFRMAVHPSSGQLFVGDVGWTQWEEINTGLPGANFGWPYYEGGNGTLERTIDYSNFPEAIAFYASGAVVTPAVYGLNHSASGINAIVLGDFLTGETIPSEYRGDLLFNDLGQGVVRNVSFRSDGTIADVELFTTDANIVVAIRQGIDGRIYFADLDDGVIGYWTFAPENPPMLNADSPVQKNVQALLGGVDLNLLPSAKGLPEKPTADDSRAEFDEGKPIRAIMASPVHADHNQAAITGRTRGSNAATPQSAMDSRSVRLAPETLDAVLSQLGDRADDRRSPLFRIK